MFLNTKTSKQTSKQVRRYVWTLDYVKKMTMSGLPNEEDLNFCVRCIPPRGDWIEVGVGVRKFLLFFLLFFATLNSCDVPGKNYHNGTEGYENSTPKDTSFLPSLFSSQYR